VGEWTFVPIDPVNVRTKFEVQQHNWKHLIYHNYSQVNCY